MNSSGISSLFRWLVVLSICTLVSVGSAVAQESESGDSDGASSQQTESDQQEISESDEVSQEDEAGDERGEEVSADEIDDGGGAGDEARDAEEREYPPEAYDPAWARYREAFTALAEGDRRAALEKLRTVEEKHEGHAAAVFARPVIEKLEMAIAEKDAETREKKIEEESEEPLPSMTDRLGLERPTGMARAELVSYQTMHGIAFGAEFCLMVECVTPRAYVGSMLIGGGAGLGLSMYATGDGITPGRASAINAGVQWGFWNAAALNTITRNWLSRSPAGIVAPLMVGQLAGLGGGYLAARHLRPNAGDVSLANSTGLWSGAFAGLVTLTAGLNPLPQDMFAALLVTSDLGVVAGGFLASQNPMPRGRVYVINTGGVLGGLLGAGGAVFFGGNRVDGQVVSGLTMLGAGGGLALSTALTTDWPLDESSQDDSADTFFSIQPTRRGEGAVFSAGGEF